MLLARSSPEFNIALLVLLWAYGTFRAYREITWIPEEESTGERDRRRVRAALGMFSWAPLVLYLAWLDHHGYWE